MAMSGKRTWVLIGVLVLVNLLVSFFPWGSYRSIVVHHTASEVSDYHTIRRSHLARGWFEIAYHFVLSNGSTQVPFGHLYPTRRYRLGLWSAATRNPRMNATAIHLSVVGNFENGPVPAPLRSALGHALAEIQRRHAIADDAIFLHRDCSPSACPGRHVDRDRLVAWAEQGSSADPAIKAQQLRALDRPRLRVFWLEGARVLANLLAFAAFLGWCRWGRAQVRTPGPAPGGELTEGRVR